VKNGDTSPAVSVSPRSRFLSSKSPSSLSVLCLRRVCCWCAWRGQACRMR
jgi:hypothetical protein